MAKKVLIKKNDASRILHTEVLPYEMPVIFSNSRLYAYAKSSPKMQVPQFIKLLLKKERDYSIPFEYVIRQGPDKKRHLFLVHPAAQLSFVDFYKNNTELILSLCGRSSYSLRYPSKVASHFYDKNYVIDDDELKTNIVDVEPDPFGNESKYSSSYFYYANYSQLFRFIDSSEWLDLETKFTNLIKFDIGKCFASIYTHSIAWAVKGKDFAKKHKGAFSFESHFDQLMGKLNYQETHGIVIGPEFSRIFAEIILQRIDLDIAEALTAQGIENSEYAIRRYVDDYFVFTRSAALGNKIYVIVQDCLKNYKLYLNESKTEPLSLPFITPQTIAKNDIQNLLKQSILSWLNYLKKLSKGEDGVLDYSHQNKLKTPYIVANELIKEAKIAVKRSGESFSIVTGRSLSTITRSLYGLHKAIDSASFPKEKELELQNILLVSIELVFFFYPMDFRVRTTYLISQFIIIVSRISKFNSQLHEFLVSSIRGHLDRVFDNLTKETPGGLEILNLLIVLKELCPDDLLDSERIVQLTNPQFKKLEPLTIETFNCYNYYDLVIVLHYIGDSAQHAQLSNLIQHQISHRFKNQQDLPRSSEFVHLFLDIVSCPYIPTDFKKELVEIIFPQVAGYVPTTNETNEVVSYCSKNLGFIDWNSDVSLEKLLQKKQLNPAY